MSSHKYRYIGDHAETLDGGRPVAPGEFVELSAEESKEPVATRFLEEGLLIDREESGQRRTKSTAGKEEGGNK